MFTHYPELLQQNELTSKSKWEVQEFCRQIEDTMKTCDLGYVKPMLLAEHIFEDWSVDAFSQANKFGFDDFEEFLRSDYMKGHIDIDDSDGITSYHFPFAKIERQKNVEKLQNELSFLDFDGNRKVNQRNNYYQQRGSCPNIAKLLGRRWCKRMGKPLPDSLKPTPRPQFVGRGRGRGFGGMTKEIGRGISPEGSTKEVKMERNMGIGPSKAVIRGGGFLGATKTMGRGDIEKEQKDP